MLKLCEDNKESRIKRHYYEQNKLRCLLIDAIIIYFFHLYAYAKLLHFYPFLLLASFCSDLLGSRGFN